VLTPLNGDSGGEGRLRMKKETFVALTGMFAILLVLSSMWTAYQLYSAGISQADAPVFPAMALGALSSVILWRVLDSKDSWHTGMAVGATALNCILVVVGCLAAWFLLLG